MTGAVDLGFWIMVFLIGGPAFIAGWIMRGLIAKADAQDRARKLHPSMRPWPREEGLDGGWGGGR